MSLAKDLAKDFLFFLLEESDAAKEAKKKGLKYGGFGRWIDKDGKMVAKTQNGQLVSVDSSSTSSKPPKQHYVRQEMPKSSLRFSSKFDEIDYDTKLQVSVALDKLKKAADAAIARGEHAPTFNLCQIHIPGTNLFCGGNMGVPRLEMPQFKGVPREGSVADKLPKNAKGEVSADDLFHDYLNKSEIKVLPAKVPVDRLKSTQNQLVGSKVAGMASALKANPNHPILSEPIYISRDGYVLDGHHRWAAAVGLGLTTEKPPRMNVKVVDMDIQDLLPLSKKFAEEVGVKQKAAESVILETSDAAKQAKKQGLKYGGFGRWVDKHNVVVAKTEGGKLVPVKGGETKTTPTPSAAKQSPEGEKDKEKSKGKMTLVGVYSGRFQPFGRHHFAAYKQLQAVTGANTYIATSDVTDTEKSPFNFAEKRAIIMKYGIPGNRVVKTRSPYNPEEVLSKYDPKTTALVVIFGAKDAGRLEGTGKYYKPFESARNLEGYKDRGYYIVAQHESVKIGGKELSGTQIRKFLGSHKIDNEKKKKLFKGIFGWYDPHLFNVITKKVGSITPKNESVLSSKGGLITEGGAYGHMEHPFDDQNLTFGDFKNIIEMALQGHLDKEAKVVEKLDGQALSISWVSGKVVAARNKGHLKNYGENALDVRGIKDMFAGRGALEKSFSQAMVDLQAAISGLTDKQKEKIFQNGKNFMALEVVYPETENVLPYGQSALIFHGVISYDANGNPVGENKEYARVLAGMIRQINADVQKTFKIEQPSFVQVPARQDFSERQKYFIAKVNKLKGQFGLKDSDTIALYHQRWWEDFISKKGQKYGMTNTTLTQLVKRWAFNDKSNKILDIVKGIKSPEFAEWVRTFDKENHDAQMKENMLPFETLFLELGSEVLSNAHGFLAANPSKAVQNVRHKIKSAINQLKGTTDLKQIKKLKTELERIQSLGGFEKIVPAEGLVFTYGGKTYKLTGAFAPVNQLLGMLKYGD